MKFENPGTPILRIFSMHKKISEVLSYEDNRLIFYQKGTDSQLTKITF